MKKILAISFVMLMIFAGCSVLKNPADDSDTNSKSPDKKTPSSSKESSKPESSAASKTAENKAPDKVAEELLDNMSSLDEAKIRELADTYFTGQSIPDAYYGVLKPISERMTYKIGDYKINGDKAEVNVTITSVDAQSAISSILPGAGAHLVAMQISGKDISNPEQILAEYAAKNITWDSLPTVTTKATLYLIKGDDGEWQIDSGNPDNYGFANAISGGGIEAAENLKGLVERFK